MEEPLLTHKRATLTQRWTDAVLNTYPADSARFMRRQKDAFANPGGHLVRQCIEALVDALEQGVEVAKVDAALEGLLKLRTLQDFTPAQAVQFVFIAKTILREELSLPAGDPSWERWDTRIDALALVAFDVYMRCREKVYEVRYNQLKKLNHVMLERANRPATHARSSGSSEWEPNDRGDEG